MKIKDFFFPTQNNKYRSHLLRIEALALFTAIIFAINIIVPVVSTQDVQAQMDINSIVYLHNRERTKRNLSTLALNSKLIESANLKADVMIEHDCWDHYCPPGTSPWENFEKVGYAYAYAGENLAEGFKENNVMMKAWMNSVTHRDNVLKSEFSEIGVGFEMGRFQGKDNNLLVAVHFGNPVGGTVKSIEKNIVISDQIDPLKNVNITKPLNADTSNNPYLSIEGIVGPGIETIELFDNEHLIAEVPVVDGRFYFTPDFTTSGFQEGIHLLIAVIYDNERNQIESSNVVNFTIDTTAPVIDLENLKVDSIIQQTRNKILLSLNKGTEDIFQSKLIYDSNEIQGIFEDNTLKYEVNYNDLVSATNVKLLVSDTAGNQSLYKISKDILLSQLDTKLENSGLSLIPFDLSNAFSVATLDFSFNFANLSLTSIINLLIVLFLVCLLAIDYNVIKNYAMIDDHRHGHHHLKIGVLLIVALFTITASGVGSILTGVNI